jgi:hypothetical protein
VNWNHLSWGAIAEIAIGVAMLVAAIWLYRRPAADAGDGGQRQYGSQGAVLLLAVAAILLIHGLGGLEYHPSEAELEAMRGGVQ